MKNLRIHICTLLFFGLFCFLFLFYGPLPFFRDFLITTAMRTKTHQYLATIFYEEEYIQQVFLKNSIIESKEMTNLDKIKVKVGSKKLYKKENIHGSGYSGYVVEIYDSTRISLEISSKLGKEGEWITDVVKRTHAKIAINSVGFYDPDWSSNGGIPHGPVIQNGKVVSNFARSSVGGGIAGFTKDGKLFLGDVSTEEALKKGIVKGFSFGPFLIMNGKKSTVVGNGGWGRAPRTAIGQRKDGTVLFVVIDGRIPSSIGASMKDLIQIMENYGAYNAVNMDGGSSSALVIHGKVINQPVGGGKNGLRKLPVFWIVK